MGDEGTTYQDLHRAVVALNDAAQAVQLVNSVPVPSDDEAKAIGRLAKDVAKLAGGLSKPEPSIPEVQVTALSASDEAAVAEVAKAAVGPQGGRRGQ